MACDWVRFLFRTRSRGRNVMCVPGSLSRYITRKYTDPTCVYFVSRGHFFRPQTRGLFFESEFHGTGTCGSSLPRVFGWVSPCMCGLSGSLSLVWLLRFGWADLSQPFVVNGPSVLDVSMFVPLFGFRVIYVFMYVVRARFCNGRTRGQKPKHSLTYSSSAYFLFPAGIVLFCIL